MSLGSGAVASRRAARRLVRLALFLVLAAGCGPSAPPITVVPEPSTEGNPPLVRVGLFVHLDGVQVGANGPFRLEDGAGTLLQGGRHEVFLVRRANGELHVYTPGGELVDVVEGALRVVPVKDTAEVTLGGAAYPGYLEIVTSPAGGLNAINVVDVESYLRGVVPMEIGHQDGGYLEAAKAQAVAARTYVAAHLGQYPEEGFDLHAGVADQVYGPVDRRHPNADRAVADTRGLILLYDDEPITANYSSTCGGKTAAAEESFETDPIPYLKSHSDDVNGAPACRNSRYFTWTESWTEAEMVKALSRTVPRELNLPWEGTRVEAISARERGPSGRVVVLAIRTDEAEYEIEKGAIRRVLENPAGKPLRSTQFDIAVRGSGADRRIEAEGHGWGHGVGMCQMGAMQMSKDGLDMGRILGHYYPGAELRNWYARSSAYLPERGGTGSRLGG